MRAIVQRVSRASVSVEGEVVGLIGAGMLVLLGIAKGDGEQQALRMCEKLMAMRIFPDQDGKMNEPLGHEREVLCVSNFTVCGDTSKGTRPSYAEAADPELAELLYDLVCDRLRAKRGLFGAMMDVELINDGPVTLVVEV